MMRVQCEEDKTVQTIIMQVISVYGVYINAILTMRGVDTKTDWSQTKMIDSLSNIDCHLWLNI